MAVTASGYLRIGTTDVDAWMAFATGVLGLMEAPREDAEGARFLRMDDHPFRFMVEPAERDYLIATGFEFADQDSWQRCCEAIAEAGHTVTAGTAEESARRCVSGFAATTDPAGNALELYWGRQLDYLPLASPCGVPAFVTSAGQSGDLGFGHVVLPAPELEATARFYTELLGTGVTDTLFPPGMPGAEIRFMHANNPRQHSVALFNAPHPQGLVHMMVEVGSMDEVGLGLDRAKAAGVHVLATLGRHVNDNMCSVYLMAPGGLAVEYGCDGLLIDPATHVATVSTEGDLWGHEYDFPGVN